GRVPSDLVTHLVMNHHPPSPLLTDTLHCRFNPPEMSVRCFTPPVPVSTEVIQTKLCFTCCCKRVNFPATLVNTEKCHAVTLVNAVLQDATQQSTFPIDGLAAITLYPPLTSPPVTPSRSSKPVDKPPTPAARSMASCS